MYVLGLCHLSLVHVADKVPEPSDAIDVPINAGLLVNCVNIAQSFKFIACWVEAKDVLGQLPVELGIRVALELSAIH